MNFAAKGRFERHSGDVFGPQKKTHELRGVYRRQLDGPEARSDLEIRLGVPEANRAVRL